MVPRWRFLATFLRPVFSASCKQHVSDLHLKFALRPHHVWKYGRHPICDGWDKARKQKKEKEETTGWKYNGHRATVIKFPFLKSTPPILVMVQMCHRQIGIGIPATIQPTVSKHWSKHLQSAQWQKNLYRGDADFFQPINLQGLSKIPAQVS